MALNDYSNLKTSIANFLARDDLTSVIPDFISLAESRMSRELDTRSQEKRAIGTTVAGEEFISLPTDLREVRMVKLNNSPNSVLEFMPPTTLYKTYNSTSAGTPLAYTIIGVEIALRPIPDSVLNVEIIYGESIASLSDTNTTNTVLTRHSDCYVYGTLAQAYNYLMDETRALQYDAMFTRIIAEIIKDTEVARFGGGALSMKLS